MADEAGSFKDFQRRGQHNGHARAIVGPQAGLRVRRLENPPRRSGLQPTQIGTVSRWAISNRRGPRIVPGNRTIRFPTSPPAGDFFARRRWRSLPPAHPP